MREKRNKNLKWTPEIVNQWRELKKQRWTYKAIAERYGVTISTVYTRLAEQL